MKTLCLSATFLILFSTSYAQKLHPHFGFKAGFNVADLKVENSNNLDPRASFYFGGLAHLHFSRHFALQPELIFCGQGAKGESAGQDYSINLNYINLPVLAQYMTGTGFRLQTGPQVGALISANSKVGDNSTDIKDNYNKIDFSWVFGASYVSNSGLGADVRYNLGLNNINDASATKIQNRVLAIGLFYQFNVSSSEHLRR